MLLLQVPHAHGMSVMPQTSLERDTRWPVKRGTHLWHSQHAAAPLWSLCSASAAAAGPTHAWRRSVRPPSASTPWMPEMQLGPPAAELAASCARQACTPTLDNHCGHPTVSVLRAVVKQLPLATPAVALAASSGRSVYTSLDSSVHGPLKFRLLSSC